MKIMIGILLAFAGVFDYLMNKDPEVNTQGLMLIIIALLINIF